MRLIMAVIVIARSKTMWRSCESYKLNKKKYTHPKYRDECIFLQLMRHSESDESSQAERVMDDCDEESSRFN